jgi:membrane protease YdiL (CAAX protease family)
MDFLLLSLVALLVSVSLVFHLRRFRSVYSLNAGKVSAEPFSWIDAVFASLLVLFIVTQSLSNLAVPRQHSQFQANTGLLVIAVLTQWVIILGPILISLRMRGARIAALFGFDRLEVQKAVGLGIALLVSALPIIFASSALVSAWLKTNQQSDAQEIIQIFESANSPVQRIPIIVLAVVGAPLAEELVFRGYLYGVLKKYFGALASMVFTAVLFALIHAHIPSLLPLFLLACVFTIAYESSGCLLVPMTMHATFNAVNLLGVLFFSP